MRTELSGLVKQGKTREDVIQYFVAQYGSQEPLASPIDKGFNRLAWFFPYAVGGFAAIAGAFVVRKWSRRSHDEPAMPQTGRSLCRRRGTAGASRPRARKPRLVPCLQRNRRPIPYGRGNSSRSARSCARRRRSSSFAARAPRTSSSCAWRSSRQRWSALRRCNALRPLATGETREPEMVGGHTRAAIEREKNMVLRSIKELEFDRAMGKVDEQDYEEMSRASSIARRAADAAARQHQQRLPGADRAGARERGW